ncbi:MAG: SDR family oxidoreductase [Phycisphaerae bacterium]|nr:SDR family oxidoreductase [Phycisphaerae bacterium]MCZ2401043.1 SDR family oxidoreductase [Phycisphaerae bacterium]NUQ49804.1 SDR family oxidoreductase [Phycisphaerae bacterium]
MSKRACLITGGSRGIGLATALRLGRAGYRVFITARRRQGIEGALHQLREAGVECDAIVADVGDNAQARGMIAEAHAAAGRLDVLVNNAGVAPLAPLEQMTAAEFDEVMRVNVAGVFHATQAAWPIFRSRRGGVVVSVSSLAAIDPFPGFAVYGASKAWVSLFTRAIAAEGKPHGIRAYAVAPGAVETTMLREHFPALPAEQTLAPDDVAGVIETLCDPRLAPASGETLYVRR